MLPEMLMAFALAGVLIGNSVTPMLGGGRDKTTLVYSLHDEALEELKKLCPVFKVLGSYPNSTL